MASSTALKNLYRTLEFSRVLDHLADRTHCSLSAERIRRLKPLGSQALVQQNLDSISEIRTFMDSGGMVPMRGFEDIRGHLKTASVEGSYLEPRAFGKIHTVVDLIFKLRHFFKDKRLELPKVCQTAQALVVHSALAKEIVRVIDLQAVAVRDSASPKLAAIRRDMARTKEQVRGKLENLLGSLAKQGALQERFITKRAGRWVVPVKDTHRHLVKGVLHDKSASGATAFVEPLQTLEMNNSIRRLQAEELHEVENVLRLLTGQIRTEVVALERDFELLVRLDCLLAQALASKALDQYAPAIDTAGILSIRGGRHPLLALKKMPLSEVVPLTLSVGDGFSTLVITGPNAGGKTVALKNVGLLALMVACGLHIPADPDSRVPVFHRIYAHVGDAQSIDMDLSTFSAHLGDLKDIVDTAMPGDLVLVDEIGSGTDPQEGAALAMAVLEALTARGVMTVVTTHHGTLKAFAHKTAGVANGSMAFDSQTLAPTYRFRADVPGSSYALEIARRLGLSESIVARSKSLMGSQAMHLEELVQELADQIDHNTLLKRDLDTQKAIVDTLRRQYETESAKLHKETTTLRREAAREARDIIKMANAAVEKAVRIIREKGASKEAIREAKARIQREKKAVKEELEPLLHDMEPVGMGAAAGVCVPGTRVSWQRGGMVGVVVDGEDQSGRVLVAFDRLRAHVPAEQLVLAGSDQKNAAVGGPTVIVPVPRDVKTQIDIRGMRVEEALDVVDKFLDDALLAGSKEVRIIHGVGTGALRESLGPFLNQHPHVRDAKPGGPRQTNLGVTVVTILQ